MAITTLKRNILYYPTINIPTDDWLRNAILYWDEISSIVPKQWEDQHRNEFSPDIQLLIDKGIFRPVRPEELITGSGGWGQLKEFTEEFKSIVESEKFQTRLKMARERFSNIHTSKIPNRGFVGKGVRMHFDKTTDGIIDFLKRRKLVLNRSGEWMRFETNTALLYMSVLAKYLACIDKQHTVVGTDQRMYENLNFQTVSASAGDAVISCDFRGLIPTPAKGVTIKEIVKFRNKRKNNLTSFRKILLDTQRKVAGAESNEEVKEILVSHQEDLRKGITDMAAVFKDSGIDLIFKSLKSIINPKSSTLVTGGALLLNEKFKVAGLPDWVSGIAIAAAGAIDIGSSFIDTRNKLRAEDRKSPFAYLYHAQRDGIVNRFS